jgi:ATP-dependent RNA helicase DDX52/ROK1
MQGIPSLLAGRDVLAAAPTGSGKTAALYVRMSYRIHLVPYPVHALRENRCLYGAPSSDDCEYLSIFLTHSVIPTLARLRAPGSVGIRALLLAPTRELAEQIHREVQRLVEGRRFKVCLLSKKISGKAIASQVKW